MSKCVLKPLVLSTTSFKDLVPYNKEKQIKEKTFAPYKVLKTKILQNCLWPLHYEGFIN
jgi:hypothetical protein